MLRLFCTPQTLLLHRSVPSNMERASFTMQKNAFRNQKLSAASDPIAMEAYQLVRRGVDARRPDRGCKAAIAEFARFVGLSESRVQAIYYAKTTRLWADEHYKLRERTRDWLNAAVARQEARNAAMRAELDAWDSMT
jgi:hypothetical protein